MKTDNLENAVLYGRKGVYKLFRQSYTIEDKYRLPVWIGHNTSSKQEITIIPIEQNDEKKLANLLNLFQKEKRFRFIELQTKDRIIFVIFDVLPSEFENIYLDLPVEPTQQNIEKSYTDNSQVIVSEQNNKKHETNNQKEKNRSTPKGVWMGALLLCVVCGISVYFAPNLFTQYPQPTNTNEIVPTASFTLLPIITEIYTQSALTTDTVVTPPTATNTTVQITLLPNTLTLTPSIVPPSDTLTPTLSITSTIGSIKTETATIVPTRTGLPGTVYLCPAESGRNVRAVPSTQNNSPLGSLQKKDCLYYEEQFTDNNGMFWVKIALNETKFPGGWVAAGNPSSKPPTIYLIGNDFSGLPTPAIPPITSTPTSTPKITPTP